MRSSAYALSDGWAMTLWKRVLGLVTLLTGASLLVLAIGQKLFLPNEPFQMGPLIGGVIWGAIAWHFGRKWLFNWIDVDVLSVDPADPAMVEAVERARGSLGVFWGYLDQYRYECFVKFLLETKEGLPEHIWAIVHSREGEKVVVSLANEPMNEPAIEDARRQVSVRDIEDWLVEVSPTEIRGGYTKGVMREIARRQGYSLSPGDRRRFEAFVDVPGST